MLKLYYLLFALQTATCSCSDEHKNGFEKTKYKISKIGKMLEFVIVKVERI
ncbi:MAG: hypothetical protein QMB03_04420 [Spirosomataceae bacterium]